MLVNNSGLPPLSTHAPPWPTPSWTTLASAQAMTVRAMMVRRSRPMARSLTSNYVDLDIIPLWGDIQTTPIADASILQPPSMGLSDLLFRDFTSGSGRE